MIDTAAFLDELAEAGFGKVAGVPCSFLGPLINEADNRGMYEPFVNEGDALAYAAGAALAGHGCAVVMQSSGLSNALSPLTSLNELFGLHTLLIIGNRGTGDEPQHRIMASVLKSFLDALHIPCFNAEERGVVQAALKCMKRHSAAILVNSRTTFSPVQSARNQTVAAESKLPLRMDMLRAVAGCVEDSLLVTTTGFTSREMFCIKDRVENFYMVGSMGCLSSLASGIADYFPDKTVIAIDGDSACLMRLGALYTLTQRRPANLCYIVLDNEANESTGGQPNSLGTSRLQRVMQSLYPTVQADAALTLAAAVKKFKEMPCYTQIYGKIRMGAAKDLPRPDRELIFRQAERFHRLSS